MLASLRKVYVDVSTSPSWAMQASKQAGPGFWAEKGPLHVSANLRSPGPPVSLHRQIKFNVAKVEGLWEMGTTF